MAHFNGKPAKKGKTPGKNQAKWPGPAGWTPPADKVPEGPVGNVGPVGDIGEPGIPGLIPGNTTLSMMDADGVMKFIGEVEKVAGPNLNGDEFLLADIKHLLPEGLEFTGVGPDNYGGITKEALYDAMKLIPKTDQVSLDKFVSGATGVPYETAFVPVIPEDGGTPFDPGVAGPSDKLEMTDPIQSMQEAAGVEPTAEIAAADKWAKALKLKPIFSKLKPATAEHEEKQKFINALPSTFKNLPEGLEHMNDPVPVEMHPMPEEYDAEKVFNAIFVMVRDQIQDEVSVASELTNKKVAKILGETLVEERVKARADQDRLQLAFDQFKLTVTTIVNNSNERIVELDAMVVEATQALTKANTEIGRLEEENRGLRVSGTLNKLPRKVRNMG